MSFVVTEPCIACRYGECVSVCPQNAFHEGPNFVVIDPRACANCGLCEMVCPVQAIHPAADLAPEQRGWVELNLEEPGDVACALRWLRRAYAAATSQPTEEEEEPHG